MKTTAIADVAWAATIRTYQDGDFFQESNTDLVADDIADRLGYLKARDLESGKLAGTNIWSGISNTFNNDLNAASATLTSAGIEDAVISNSLQIEGTVEFVNGSAIKISSGETLADASVPITQTIARVPTITANRVYTLPAASDGRIVYFARLGTAAFTATLQTSGAVTLGVVPSGQAGFIKAWCDGATWKVLEWSANITSLLATV
ncbi:MAG: hypothetical protein ACRCU1_03480 [Alsobacter sp.]